MIVNVKFNVKQNSAAWDLSVNKIQFKDQILYSHLEGPNLVLIFMCTDQSL
jgi:hypothetical protein